MPTEQDINVYDSLDERSAVENFLGKDLDQAYELFRENYTRADEDLTFMGPKAFVFYVPAAIRYLLSEDSKGHTGAAYRFWSTIESRLESNREEIASTIPLIRSAIVRILENIHHYDNDPEVHVYAAAFGDLADRYRHLLAKLDEEMRSNE